MTTLNPPRVPLPGEQDATGATAGALLAAPAVVQRLYGLAHPAELFSALAPTYSRDPDPDRFAANVELPAALLWRAGRALVDEGLIPLSLVGIHYISCAPALADVAPVHLCETCAHRRRQVALQVADQGHGYLLQLTVATIAQRVETISTGGYL